MSLIANGAGESAASNFYNGAVSSSIRMQNARLTETPGATGNDKKWTFSAWIKRGKLGASYIFAGTPHGGYNGIAAIYFESDNTLHTYYDTSGANPYGAVGPRLYRDTSSWYHLVWAVDAANTVHKIWITFLRESKRLTKEMNKKYTILTNSVDAEYTTAIKWLKFLGFTFINKHNNWGKTFLEFVRI